MTSTEQVGLDDVQVGDRVRFQYLRRDQGEDTRLGEVCEKLDNCDIFLFDETRDNSIRHFKADRVFDLEKFLPEPTAVEEPRKTLGDWLRYWRNKVGF